MSQQTIERGPIVEVAEREYTKPIPDEFLPLLRQAGLVVADHDHYPFAYHAGFAQASVWGPAVEGHWFARVAGEKEAVRVESRDAGLRYVLNTRGVTA